MWHVENTENFWKTFFSLKGCFKVVRVTSDFTHEKIKELMKDYAPKNAEYVNQVPIITVQDIYAGTIKKINKDRKILAVIDLTGLTDRDFCSIEMMDFQDRLMSLIFRHRDTPIRVIIPDNVSWHMIGHNDLRESWNVHAYVCLNHTERF